MTDPRDGFRLLPRDLAAGRWIGEGYEVAQYQLHEAVFPGKSAVVVSRFVKRWKERGLIAVERWNRIGMNRLRLTKKGRDTILLAGAAKPEDLFVPRKPVAPKDLAHRLWVNDLRVALGSLTRKPYALLPHWAIERRFVPRWPAIPDLLAIWAVPESGEKTVLAIEVDLGGEPLRSVFLPKLKVLQGVLAEIGQVGRGAIVILTTGASRAASIQTISGSNDGDVMMNAGVLPLAGGRRGLQMLREAFSRSVQSTARSEEPKPSERNCFRNDTNERLRNEG